MPAAFCLNLVIKMRSLVTLAIVFVFAAVTTQSVPASTPEWMRGSGLDLEIRIAGQVVDPVGKALDAKTARELEFTMKLQGLNRVRTDINCEFQGGKFRAWIPVYRPSFYTLELQANDVDGNRFATRSIGLAQFRAAAAGGVTMKLQPLSRAVDIRVTDEANPVPGAQVHATFFHEKALSIYRTTAVTDGRGIATFRVPEQAKLSTVAASTKDLRVGGYSIYREPDLDGTEDEFECELTAARQQVFRCVDETGQPVQGIDFLVEIATNDFNYLGEMPQARLTTGKEGTAIHRCFPDWSENHCYIEVANPTWYCVGDLAWERGTATQVLGRMPERVTVTGKLEEHAGLAGRLMHHHSFQHPQQNRSDRFVSLIDSEGRFFTQAMPGGTYLTFLNDQELISESIAWTAPTITPDGTAEPSELAMIALVPGVLTTAQVVSGADRQPVAGVRVGFKSDRTFSYFSERFNREVQGDYGRDVFAETDPSGVATMRVPPGDTTVSSYLNGNRQTESLTIRSGDTPKVILHHSVPVKRTLIGSVVGADDSNLSGANARLQIASVDQGKLQINTAVTDSAGNFTVDSDNRDVAILANSADGRGYAARFVDPDSASFELKLNPAKSFRGQLLLPDGSPIADHTITAQVWLQSKRRDPPNFPATASLGLWETQTNAEGMFDFDGLPSELPLQLSSSNPELKDAPNARPVSLGKLFLRPGEDRPLWTGTLGHSSRPSPSEAPRRRSPIEVVEAWLKDCRRDHYHLLVMRVGDSAQASRAVDQVLSSYDDFDPVTRYLNCFIGKQEELTAQDRRELAERDWAPVEEDEFFVAALDATGRELGRVRLKTTSDEFTNKFKAFVVEHCPPKVDAEAAWKSAFEQAKQSGRRVWAVSGGRYCGPCFMLSRWQDKHREILDREFVLLKVDEAGHLKGTEVARRITLDEYGGIPFHAIFDADGNRLINSLGPLGNIGMPSGYEGTEHLATMLRTGRVRITEDEIAQLIQSLRK